jgi:molybdate transport system substrate-binding protein
MAIAGPRPASAAGRVGRRRALLGGLAISAWPFSGSRAANDEVATVAAASDLQFVLPGIAAGFERASGYRLRLVFGSSGNFFAQLLQGAPFQMYLSADEDFVLRLARAGKTPDDGRLYARGRIGLMVPAGSPLLPDGSLRDLAAALADGRLKRLAIANPQHAPYGRRAEEALRHAGRWDAIQSRLVMGENVSQAAQFATSGSTQGGIIALSLARAPQLARRGRFALIDASWHQPLLQRMVLMNGAGPAARAFYEHLSGAAAQADLARHGFALQRD